MARIKLQRKGFSLIELLIVIAIIGIIATIAIPILLSARIGAVNEKARNSLRSLVTAQQAYYAANGTYGTLAQLNTSVPSYIDTAMASGTLGSGISITCTPSGQTFVAAATTPAGTGYKDFATNETGLITETVK